MDFAGHSTLKRNFFKAKKVTVSPLVLLVLSACGGGSSGSNTATNTTTVSGAVVKGPLQNAFVFLDLDGDGQRGATEPSARTDSAGAYSLVTSTSNASVVAKTDSSTIDTSSGEVLDNVTLKAPAGAKVVTPMTTIMQEASISAADVVKVLGLPASVDPLTFNPFSNTENAAIALQVEKASQQVMTTIKAVSAAAEGAGASADDAFSVALEAVVEVVKEKATGTGELDLANTAELDAITSKAATKLTEKASVDNAKFEAVASDLKAAVVNVNKQISEVTDLTSDASKAAFSVSTELQAQVKGAATTGSSATISFANEDNVIAAKVAKEEVIASQEPATEETSEETVETPVVVVPSGGGGGNGGGSSTSTTPAVSTKTAIKLASRPLTVESSDWTSDKSLGWQDEVTIKVALDNSSNIFASGSNIVLTLNVTGSASPNAEVTLDYNSTDKVFEGTYTVPVNATASSLAISSAKVNVVPNDTDTYEISSTIASGLAGQSLEAAIDSILPSVAVTSISYDTATDTITIVGTGFDDVSDLDLSKLKLDIDNDGTNTDDKTFSVSDGTVSVTSTGATIKLGSSVALTLEAMTEFGLGTDNTRDYFEISAGFFKDAADNTSVGTDDLKWKIPTITSANYKSSTQTLSLYGEDLDGLSASAISSANFKDYFTWKIDGTTAVTVQNTDIESIERTGSLAIDIVLKDTAAVVTNANVGGAITDTFSISSGFIDGLDQSLPTNVNIVNDTTAPSLSSFSISGLSDGDKISPDSDPITIIATMDESVKAGSTMTVQLNVSNSQRDSAPYAVQLTAADAGTTLSGEFTPTSQDNQTNAISVNAASLQFTSGTGLIALQDLAGNLATASDISLTGITKITSTTGDIFVDRSAPTAQLQSAKYDHSTNSIILTAKSTNDFSQIEETADEQQDIKSYLDWSKFNWVIDTDGKSIRLNDAAGLDATAANTTYVTSAKINEANTTLTIKLTDAGATLLEGDANFANYGASSTLSANIDALKIYEGFIRDKAGNYADLDGSGSSSASDFVTITGTNLTYENGGSASTAPSVSQLYYWNAGSSAWVAAGTSGSTLKFGDTLKFKAVLTSGVSKGSKFTAELQTRDNDNTPLLFKANSNGTELIAETLVGSSSAVTVGSDDVSDNLKLINFTKGTNTADGLAVSGQYTTTSTGLSAQASDTFMGFAVDGAKPELSITAANYNPTTNKLILTTSSEKLFASTSQDTSIVAETSATKSIASQLGSGTSAISWQNGSTEIFSITNSEIATATGKGAFVTATNKLEIELKNPGTLEGKTNYGVDPLDESGTADKITIAAGFFGDAAGNTYGTAMTVPITFDDNTAPKIVSVDTKPNNFPDGTYSAAGGSYPIDGYENGKIPISITFDEVLHSSSTLRVKLSTQKTLDLSYDSSASGKNVLTGTYTIGSAETASDLEITDIIDAQAAVYDLYGNKMLVTSDIPAGENLSDNANINISNLNAADVLVDAVDTGVIDSGDELLFRFTRSVDNPTGASSFQSDLGLSANYSWNENYDRLTATLTANPPASKLSSDGNLEIDDITVNFASGSDEVLSFTFDVA
jgi:hypothetical protein